MSEDYVPPTGQGRCCACRQVKYSLRNLVGLGHPAPVRGTGWGCVVCDLPNDGALAIVCDGCAEAGAEIRDVCGSFPLQPERVPVAELSQEDFAHHVSKHPELQGEAV